MGQPLPTGARRARSLETHLCPHPPWASASPSVEWGRRGQGACHSPRPAVRHASSWADPQVPRRNPFLSTFECFNLLHPPRRALGEAGRPPRLRAIKQLTVRGAEPAASGWEQRGLPEREGGRPQSPPPVPRSNRPVRHFSFILGSCHPLFSLWLKLQNSSWHPWSLVSPAARAAGDKTEARRAGPGPDPELPGLGPEPGPVSLLGRHQHLVAFCSARR